MVAAVKQEQVDQSNVLFEEVSNPGDAVPMEGGCCSCCCLESDAAGTAGRVLGPGQSVTLRALCVLQVWWRSRSSQQGLLQTRMQRCEGSTW